MNTVTTNYGLAGGELDASKHIEAAIPRLLTPTEAEACLRCSFTVAVTSKSKRDCSDSN